MGAYAEHWAPGGHGKRSLSGLYYTHVHCMGKNAPCTAQKCNEDSKEGIRPGRRDAGCASGPFLVHPFSAAPPREGGENGVPPAPRRSARGTASQRSGRRTGQRGCAGLPPPHAGLQCRLDFLSSWRRCANSQGHSDASGEHRAHKSPSCCSTSKSGRKPAGLLH